MRKNQVNINICRIHDQVPVSYPEERQIISIYSDSNNLYEALGSAYAKAIDTIAEWERVAVRTNISTNADGALSGKLLGRLYTENTELENVDKRLELNRELLFYIEHSEDILRIIKSSKDKATARKVLQDRMSLSQQQIASILRLRFDMFTLSEVEEIKEDIRRMEALIRSRPNNKL